MSSRSWRKCNVPLRSKLSRLDAWLFHRALFEQVSLFRVGVGEGVHAPGRVKGEIGKTQIRHQERGHLVLVPALLYSSERTAVPDWQLRQNPATRVEQGSFH